jgi:hypothetical protein
MPRCAPLIAALVAAALAPAAATAAAPWSAPQDLSSAHLFVDGPRIVAGGDGSALAWWAWQDRTGEGARTGVSLAARSAGAPAFAGRRAAPSGLADVAAYGASRAVAAVLRPSGDVAAQRSRVAVAFGRTSGRFDAARTLFTGARVRAARIAAGADGHAALAFWQDRGTRTDRVYVSLRSPGGRFGAPVRLTEGRVRSVAVAVGPEGGVLVAWDALGRVRARYRSPGARRFSSTETIRSEPAFFAGLHAAVTDGGRAYLAWSAQFQSEGGERGPVFYQAAVRSSGGRFREAQLLERQGAERPRAGIALALAPRRGATVAWTGFDGATARARVADTDAAGRFGAARDVSPAGETAVVSDVAASADGARLVVWDNGGFEADQVRAAAAPAGGAFGAPETVSPGGAAEEARLGRAVFGRGGEPTVVWTDRPEGSPPPGGAAPRTFARAATRP